MSTSATTVIEASDHDGKAFPVVLRNRIGTGTVLTVLLEDDVALGALALLPHLLSRMASDVLPFEVVDVESGADMLATKLEMLLARRHSGWQVTLVNNFGVTKQPGAAATVDPSKRVRAVLRLKRAYGAATAVTLVAADGATPLIVSNNSVTVEVEAGDLAVLAVELA